MPPILLAPGLSVLIVLAAALVGADEARGAVGITRAVVCGNLREWTQRTCERCWIRRVFRGVYRRGIRRSNQYVGSDTLLDPVLERNEGVTPRLERNRRG